MIFSLKIFFHLSTDEKIVMRNLARGRVTGRIIAHNSIPLPRNVRNAPAAVRLSRIVPARSHRASAMQSAEAKLHRRAKALVCADSPARSENRPTAVRPSSSEKHRMLSEIPRFRSEHPKRPASPEASHILSQPPLSLRISRLSKKIDPCNHKVLAFLNSPRYKQD